MENFILSCCSTADLAKGHFEERNIHYICFHFSLNDRQYADDLGRSISFPDFYEAMRRGAETKTSQVNEDEFEAYFTPFLENGQDIVHVCLSSGISGVYNSAMLAKRTLEEKYPERKIFVLDSLLASSGYGLLMDALADRRDEGMTAEEVYAWGLAHRLNFHAWFFSTDLTYYVKGGRVSRASGLVGSVLHICPLLHMDQAGKLIPKEKIRTKKKVIVRIVEKMMAYARDRENYSGKCFISHSDCLEDAQAVAALVEEKFPHLNGKVLINSVGTTIGSHTGPGTVALFFEGDLRQE